MDLNMIINSVDDAKPPDPGAGAERKDSTGTPLQRTSPEKTPLKLTASQLPSPSPLKIPKSSSRANTPNHERQPMPVLQTRRSSSNLTTSRNLTPSRQQSRRPSSNLNPLSASLESSSNTLQPEPVLVTPGSVATDYFRRELESHTTTTGKVVVLTHDSCFGHRFSRPKTSKATLGTIVERPERLLATLLGASAAYVRLGGRHAADKYGPHPDRDPSATPPPPFIVRKTNRFIDLNHPAVTNVHGTKWMEELQIMCDSAEAKLAMNGKELTRPIGYGKDEDGKALPKLHEGDLYLCAESLNALRGCLGGVCDAVDAVFSPDPVSRAFVNIRPPGHHCSSTYPSGFCWLNNVHVGISYAATTYGLTHAAIIDFDLHHGDGSQTIAWNHNSRAQSLPKNAAAHKKVPIGYYSLHDINSYPCEWGDEEKVRNASLCIQNAHGQSIWNVHLEPWTSLDHFWSLYESKYTALLEKTRVFLQHYSDKLRRAGGKPKAAIFLSAGFDASQWESEGMQRHSVNVPTEFYARFTADVVRLAEEQTLGVEGRVVSVLEGGYSDRALTSGVLSHLCGLTVGEAHLAGLNGANVSNITDTKSSTSPIASGSQTSKAYDPAWWDESLLTELETMVRGDVPTPQPKPGKSTGNYSSPTQASTLRMTETARERQSLSAQLESRLSLGNVVIEPPPEVDWVTATYELSRLLIPNDRQTLSCRHDELNAEATRARRERQSMLSLPTQTEERMQLRDRKAKPLPAASESARAAARSTNRRTTIAAVNELPDPAMVDSSLENRPRRRSSAASSILSSFQGMSIDDPDTTARPSAPFVTRSQNQDVSTTRPLEAKKSRPNVTRRQSNSRRSSDEEKHLSVTYIPHGPAPQNRTAVGQIPVDGSSKRSPSPGGQNSVGSSAAKDEVDNLTNGMKKVSIKLKMPTPEQHAANQKKVEDEKPSKAKLAKKPAVGRAPKPKSNVPVKSVAKSRVIKPIAVAVAPAATHAEVSKEKNSTPVMHPRTAIAGADHPRDSPGAAQQPDLEAISIGVTSGITVNPSSEDVLSIQHVPQIESTSEIPGIVERSVEDSTLPRTEQEVIPSRPEAPTPITVMQSEVTPTHRTREDLPVFTSTSPIPFANARSSSLNAQAKGENVHRLNKSIWDVPDTPQK